MPPGWGGYELTGLAEIKLESRELTLERREEFRRAKVRIRVFSEHPQDRATVPTVRKSVVHLQLDLSLIEPKSSAWTNQRSVLTTGRLLALDF